MPSKTKIALVVALLTAMLAGGAVGLALFGPGSASAQSSKPAASSPPAVKTFKSNEDATHEKGESAAREADETAGRAFHGMHACPQTSAPSTGTHHSCEDAAHEKGESAAREADEDAGRANFHHAGGRSDQNG